MDVYLEALLELDFCTKLINFGVEAHMEAPTEVALSGGAAWSLNAASTPLFTLFFARTYFATRN
jgi:hypothetical protein